MLAGELAKRPGHTAAFTAYEQNTRALVGLNQGPVTEGDAAFFPPHP